MTLSGISIPLAAAAGAASFLSPCVLPLVPAYLGFLGGTAAGPGGGAAASDGGEGPASAGRPRPGRARLLGSALAFVLGLSLFFVVFFYSLQTVLEPWRAVALPVLGGLVVVLGLQYMGLVRIPLLMRDTRRGPTRRTGGAATGFLLGLGFAAGWTPCIGPILSAVLTSGLAQGTTARGLILIGFYCAGLGLPFLLMAWLVDRATPALRAVNRHQRLVSIGGGLLVVAMGVLVITDHVTVLNTWFSTHLPAFFQDPFHL